MIAMVFQPTRYSRTMTREEWYRTYRWVRQTRKELQTNEQKMLAAALVCTDDRIKANIMEHIIRPPLMAVPALSEGHTFNLAPGSIHYVNAPRKSWLP